MIFMSVLVSGISLLVGVLMGMAVGRDKERSRWESKIGRTVVDGLGVGTSRGLTGLDSDSRSDRMEQAIEAIAIEVERVAEGQRFVTKLLAERGQPLLDRPAQPKQSITPH
jgi:hypothetical protein